MKTNILYAIDITYLIFALSVIFVCICYIIFALTILPVIKQNKVIKELKSVALSNSIDCSVKKSHIYGSNFILNINDKTYFVKVIDTPKNCDLQINNIDTWYYYKNQTGKMLANKSSKNLLTFMKAKVDNKIIILSNKAKTIKKVINECEMIMVNENTDVYSVKILNRSNYNSLF